MENYIVKVWTIEQRYYHPAPEAAWQPSREEMEQYQIDRERNKEMLESYKVVERILDGKEEKTVEGLVISYFCKWTSRSNELSSYCSLTSTDLQYVDCTWEGESTRRRRC